MAKILFIITQSEIGGAQRYLLELAPYLASRGHEIIVAAGEGDGELFDKFRISPPTGDLPQGENFEFRIYNIKSLTRNLNPTKDVITLFAILKIIKNEHPNILFLQSTKTGFLGSLASRIFKIQNSKFKIRVIYRIGGWSFRDPRSWWMNKILFYMEKIIAAWKNVIIVNSEFDRQIAINKKIAPADKIFKIYNGVNPYAINFLDKISAREALTIKEDMAVGTIANLYATKGIEYFIEAVNILLKIQNSKFKIHFIVIGEGKERSNLESLIKKYNLEKNFFLIGRKQDAYKYLKAFDIFVLPSIKEGMPWAILEAMSAGVPIIATRVGAVPEILEDNNDGLLVSPGDSAAIAEKIKMLIENPDLRKRLTENAANKLKKFSLKRMLEESEAVTAP